MPATEQIIKQGRSVFTPVDLDAHDADMAKRKAELESHRKELRRCLSPKFAGRAEVLKPLYEWRVQCSFWRPDPDNGGEFKERKEDKQVVAQTENDAWAIFCDSIREWPSRNNCDSLKITQLEKIN